MGDYQGGDRRPIASRSLRIFQVSASLLARAGISANAISVAGMVFGLAGAAALAMTGRFGGTAGRILFAAAAVGIQMRLIANMLDGMVAIAAGKASAVGELFNEIPDRISDTAILACAGYAAGGSPTLGWAAACVALFVTYIRAVGKGVGVLGLFQGPMAKSHRMFLLTITCVYLALTPAAWHPHGHLISCDDSRGLISAALAIVILGGLLTALRRLLRIVHALKGQS